MLNFPFEEKPRKALETSKMAVGSSMESEPIVPYGRMA